MAETTSPPRRFTLLDMIAIVLATGVLAWVAREGHADKIFSDIYANIKAGHTRPLEGADRWIFYVVRVHEMVSPPLQLVLIVAAATLNVLRFVRPRPELHELASQPGAMACLVGFLGFLAFTTEHAMIQVFRRYDYQGWGTFENFKHPSAGFLYRAANFLVPPAGIYVLGAWVVMFLQGRFRGQADWIEKAGRVVGACWILAHLGNAVTIVLGYRLT